MKVKGINKTQMVRDLLKSQPNLSAKEIADVVDCHITIVHDQRRRMTNKTALTKKKVGRTAKKKLGRPSNMQKVSDGIAEASTVLAELASMYGLLVTFFEGKVIINKEHVDYECKPADVPALLGSIAYLNTFAKQN